MTPDQTRNGRHPVEEETEVQRSTDSNEPGNGQRRRAVRRAVAATLAAGLLFVAACGDDDGGMAMTGTAPPVVADDGPVEVTLVDYGFEGLPETVPAGTQFTIVNESKVEVHEFVAFRLDDDDDRSADEIAKLPMDELMALFSGEPATVLLAAPNGGEQIDAVGDGTLSEPGRYVVFCVIPTGADPEEYLNAAGGSDGPPQVAGGAPHFVNGMYGEVTVEG
jgi:hypothetical protein